MNLKLACARTVVVFLPQWRELRVRWPEQIKYVRKTVCILNGIWVAGSSLRVEIPRFIVVLVCA